jgi:hypothetical protein
MNEDYLWDRTGEPDPEIVRLEEALGRLKYEGRDERLAAPRRKTHVAWWLATAAALAGLAVVPFLARGPLTNWRLQSGVRVRAGATITSGAITSSETGQVTIDPGSRFRLLEASGSQQRFDLQRGAIHALIWAPPGRFVVDTPSSKTIDLGCRYTLQVSHDGTGLLTVELGWVAFERDKVESFIPAGAACVTRPGRGPGTPYFQSASPALIGALGRFDAGAGDAALDSAIAAASPRDGLSLWHLMMRTRGSERARVFDRLAGLVNLPPEASRDAILRGDGAAIDAAWNALNLGETSWWREWKWQW